MSKSGGWPDYLRALMRSRRIESPAELSRRLGVGEAVVSRWLNGKAQPSVDHLRRLARVMKVRLPDLLIAAGHVEASELQVDEPKPPADPEPMDPAEAVHLWPDYTEREKAFILGAIQGMVAGRETEERETEERERTAR